MMRSKARFLGACLLLAACTATPKVLDFAFAPPGGGKAYRSTTIEQSLRVELRDQSQPSIIVVSTPSADDPTFRKQLTILKKLPAEELEALFVVACPTGSPPDVYAMADKTAEKLFGKNPDFRVFILDGVGRVRHASWEVLDAKQIRAVIEERWLATGSSP